MADRCLADWLTLLEARHPSEIDLGLERVSAVWQRCQQHLPRTNTPNPRVITVAGTNGKGSCVTSMQAVMLEHGYRVGSFTSPHFLRFNERICIAGQPVSDHKIVAAFEQIEALREDISLTYFEFNTLAALLIFSGAALDLILLEVGLGGRLDAANIIDADVAVLTSVDLDHQQWLGDTRTEIAGEKLGIARSGRPLIIGETDYPENFENLVAKTAADALWIGRDFSYQTGDNRFSVSLSAPLDEGVGAVNLENLPVAGLLPINKTLALQALLCAGFQLNGEKCRVALDNMFLRGRQQRLTYQGVNLILDVAHNPAAAAVLAAELAAQQVSQQVSQLSSGKGRYIAVAGVLEDKDWSAMVTALKPVIDDWKVAQLQGVTRSADGQSLLNLLYNSAANGTLHNSVEQAFISALSEADSGDTVAVFGSFYTVAEVLRLISKGENSEQ